MAQKSRNNRLCWTCCFGFWYALVASQDTHCNSIHYYFWQCLEWRLRLTSASRKTLVKAVDTATGVCFFLLTRIKRVTSWTDIKVHIFRHGRCCFNDITAATSCRHLAVFWVYFVFHGHLLYFLPPPLDLSISLSTLPTSLSKKLVEHGQRYLRGGKSIRFWFQLKINWGPTTLNSR